MTIHLSSLIVLPEHKCSLSITHNQHKDFYEELKEYIDDHQGGKNVAEFETEETKARAIATDEIWEIQWHPNTPIGFNRIAAPTLQEALDFANRYAE